MLTGYRDVDFKILNNLDDKSLVKFCETNTKASELCNDQTFWMNRILTKFPYIPLEVLKKYKGDRSWSEYYIYDLRKYKIAEDRRVYGRLDHLMILIEQGVSEEFQDILIARAIRIGRVDILKYLLSKGFQINNINSKLIRSGNVEMIKFLVGLGADIKRYYQPLITDLFPFRPQNEQLDIIKYLHDIGLDMHFNNEEVLILAAREDRLNIVKYLVEHGANIHVDHDKPVREAHKQGHKDVVEYLVSQGSADPRIY